MLAAAKPNRTTDAISETPALDSLHHLLSDLAVFVVGGAVLGVSLGALLILTNRRGSFALWVAIPGPFIAAVGHPLIGWTFTAGCVVACAFRERWRFDEIKKGGDKARKQRNSVGVIEAVRNWRERRRFRHTMAVEAGRYPIGQDTRGRLVWLPLGLDHGQHTLLVGATGAGKTNTVRSTIYANLTAGCGVVMIDPKGDREVADELRQAAYALDRPFWHFSLDGPSDRWNPLAHGSPTELTDKLIAAEDWTEPHYKRLYQRYLLAVFVAMRHVGDEPDLAKVVNLLHPDRFALYVRSISDDDAAEQIGQRLASLTAEETRDLAGLRNRLAILAESDHGELLSSEGDPSRQIDLLLAITQGAVVVFSLNSSSSPETAKLLGAAIFQDLKHVAGVLEANAHLRQPAAIVVDEFGAFGADHVLGLFQRARSAKLSLTLITQELADLQAVAPAFRDQIVGNVETIIAHRQSTPESAELVAELAGTEEVWIHTWQTDEGIPAGSLNAHTLGSKRRGREFTIAPDTIKRLQTGEAVVITKNPHDVRHAYIYRTDYSDTSQPIQPQREAEARVLAYANGRPDRLHNWHHRN